MNVYNILDFKAVMKHAFYSGTDEEAIHCEDTDRTFNTWQCGAQRFLELYSDAVFGDEYSPRHLIVAHDMGQEYRSALYPEYKKKRSKREKSPVEIEQVNALYDWAKKFFTHIGATQLGVEGVEADDVIAWLTDNISEPKQVFTVDEDLLQLASDSCIVYLKLVPHAQEGEHKGIPYHLTSVAKSMLGDTSDEYGGVPQFGPAKFTKLMDDYGESGLTMLRDIIDSNDDQQLEQAIAENPDKLLIMLKDNFSTWRKMWMLAKLHPELCWKPRGNKLTKPVIHKRIASGDRVQELLDVVGASDFWEDEFEEMMPRSFAVTGENWEDMKEAIKGEMAKGDIVAFDYETADKEPHQPFIDASSKDTFVDVLSHRLTGASFQFGKHLENSIYVSVDHAGADNLPVESIRELLEHAQRSSQLVAQNAFFEGVVSRTNLDMKLCNVHDTRIMQRYFNENDSAGLKSMSKAYLNYSQDSYEDTVGDKANMSELTLDEVLKYGIDDSLVTGSIYDLLKLMLQLDGQWEFYQRWAVRPTEVLQDSYIKGVDVDWDLQAKIHAEDIEIHRNSVDELHRILGEHAKDEINSGCRSFIEAEKEYITKGHRRKLRDDEGLSGGDLKAAVDLKVNQWKAKFEGACGYQPYSVREEMPSFTPSTKKLNEALGAVGLPEVSGAGHRTMSDYLDSQGMYAWSEPVELEVDQREVLLAITQLMEQGAYPPTKRTQTRKAYEEQIKDLLTEDKESKAFRIEQKLGTFNAAIDAAGEVCQRVMGVEPKTVKEGDELSIGSPQQMQQLIYCKLGMPVRLFGTSLGMGRIQLGITQASPSTDEKAIQTALANDVEEGSWQERALKVLLSAKTALTKITLYHNKYPLWQHPIDGKVHPSFTDAGTDTRRPTGSAPNMLQVSKKDKEMRQMFHGPTKDHVTVAIDYASQEIRLMACEAQDRVMMDVYDPENEKDLHSMTGSAIAGMSYEAFTQALEDTEHKLHPLVVAVRGKKGKPINFGIAYGAGAFTVSRSLIVPVEEAKALLDDAFNLYDRIKPWQEETGRFMSKNGFTITAFGTKRHATDDIFHKDKGKVARQHRQGTNATIQGTAAEMLRIVLTHMAETEMLERLDMVFFAPIYDEVVSFVHKDDVYQYCLEMRDIMAGATPPTHEVPQVPEFSIGDSWGTVRELGRWPGREAIEAAVEAALPKEKELQE